ncbi:hypothetical protein M569_03007 [Genlisea aurea]|uniref:Uncharacterized protein n=1 Tax=Genlisea aurea TaxID=192259 RepID=S8CXP4_9LAMI|nr:hypothetical protein M569_03007 [Genlisea aurea]
MENPRRNGAVFVDDDLPEPYSGGGFLRRFCCCFDGGAAEAHQLLQEGRAPPPMIESWIVEKAKSLREYSEVVAGPKFKNLMRRMGRILKPRKQRSPEAQFQYSPGSYALNFSGEGDDWEEEGGALMHNFSYRFAGAPAPADHQRT